MTILPSSFRVIRNKSLLVDPCISRSRLNRFKHGYRAKMPIEPLKLHTDLSDPEFMLLLRSSEKYKKRSDETHNSVHKPLLESTPSKPIWCLLLGCSTVERLKTTGAHTTLGKGQFPHIFNAGVGGDRIRNVLYRLGTKGLFWDLQTRQVEHAILMMGANDVTNKQALDSEALRQYALVLEALYRACPAVKVLVTGLTPQKPGRRPRMVVREGIINHSNASLQRLVQAYQEMNKQASSK